MTTDITTDDLRAAYERARLLRLAGYSFARAMNTDLVRRGLELSARAWKRLHPTTIQPRLI